MDQVTLSSQSMHLDSFASITILEISDESLRIIVSIVFVGRCLHEIGDSVSLPSLLFSFLLGRDVFAKNAQGLLDHFPMCMETSDSDGTPSSTMSSHDWWAPRPGRRERRRPELPLMGASLPSSLSC